MKKTGSSRPAEKAGTTGRNPQGPEEKKGDAGIAASAVNDRYRLIFAHSPIGIVHFDAQGMVTDCNDRFAEILGAPCTAIRGSHILEDFRDGPMRSAVEACVRGEVGRFEGAYRSVLSGRHLDVSATFGPMVSPEGVVTGGIGIFEDIGARVKAERELRDRETLLEAIIDTEPECVKMLDAEGRVLMMNAAGLAMIQADSLEQVKGRSVYPLIVPEHREAFRRLTTEVFEGKTGSLEFEVIGIKGGRIALDTRAVPFKINERVECLLAVTRNVTEQNRIMESLRSSEEDFKSLFENSPLSLWLEDLSDVKRHLEELLNSGVDDLSAHIQVHPEIVPETLSLAKVLDVNRATLDLYGAESKDELLADLGATFTARTLEGYAAGLVALAEGKTQFEVEVQTATLGGEKLQTLVKWSVVPGYERDYSRVVVSIVDLTEHRKNQTLLRTAGESLGEKTGEEYFHSVVAAVAETLGTAFAFVGEKLPERDRVETRAVYANGGPAAAFGYDLPGTPCGTVVGGAPCFFPEGVAERFPDDLMLRDRAFESYAATPLFSSSGEPLGLLTVCDTEPMDRDAGQYVLSVLNLFAARVSAEIERSRVETSLRESQARLSRAQAMAHVGDWAWDVMSGRVSWSDELFRIYGYEPGEIAPDYDLVLRAMDPEDKEFFLGEIDAALKGERPFEMDYRFFTKDGTKRTLHTIGKVQKDEAGGVVGMVGTVQDITDRVRTQEALRESEERFRLLFESSPDAGILADVTTGRIIDVNTAACRLFGESRERLIGKRQTELHPPESDAFYRSAFLRHVGESSGGSTSGPLEAIALRADGGRVPVEIVAQRIALQGIPVLYGVFRDITERKKAEAVLRVTEERYRDLFENAGDPIFILDAEHRYVDVNRRATEVFGFSREEFLSMGVFDLIPEDQKARSEQAFTALRTRGAYERFESRMRTKDGRWRHIAVSSSAIEEDGTFLGSRDIVRDVTEEQEARNLLQRNRDMLSRAEEIGGMGSWEWDLKSNSQRWSEEVFRIYGLDASKNEPSYELMIKGVHPEDRDRFMESVSAVLKTGEPLAIEATLLRPDGGVRFTHSKAEIIRDEAGRMARLVGIIRDITEQKRSEDFVRDILETVDEAFLIVGPDYSVLSANRAYAEQAGLPLETIIGRKCHEISHKSSTPCFEHGEDCGVRKVFETGNSAEVVHIHADAAGNEIYVETKAFPMKDPTGRVIAAIEIVNNITEKRKLEEQLRQAQKLEAVGLLAGGVAHDFNNLLTAITGYGNLLSMKLAPHDPLRDYAEQIMKASDRATTLTQSLLAFSRKQIVRPEPVDLNDIVEDMEKLLHRVIEADVDIRIRLAPGGCTVLADRGQTEQVLINLATNARDAMPNGGVLTISTENVLIDEEFQRKHGFGEEGSFGALKVEDTGTGLDERTRERIFEPFFTTKELGRGTGLGLATVYGIVKKGEGFITVDSEPGEGSVFSVLLPATSQTAVKRRFADESAPRNGKETILLAEDDAAVRELLKDVLGQFGYDVIEAGDGEEAVRKFSEHRERIALLILDVMMPKKNGKEAYAEIRLLGGGAKTLFMSGYSSHILDPELLQTEGCYFIGKPVSPPRLLREVRGILDER